MRKVLLVIGIIILIFVLGGGVFVASRQHLTFDAPYPDVTASSDSSGIERGRYIVRDLASCATCHGDPAQRAALATGADVPLSGGFVFDIPPGQFFSRNLTSDGETGLGNVPDSAIARALLPFREMQGLSDDDLVAVVAYLRSQPPVRNPVPSHHFTLLGKVLRATVLAQPVGPATTPLARAPRGASLETGRYLVESVALCGACHTERSQMTGAFTGPRFGGTRGLTESDDPGHSWSPPNITSDPETGRLGAMTEDQFVARFRQGRVLPGSPMPWPGFARLAEEDLRAISRYLKSVPPVKNDVGPSMVNVGTP